MRTEVGYAGGKADSAVYTRMHDHSETVLVEFDPTRVSYSELLKVFWDSHNPVAEKFSRQYRNAVFYTNEQQRQAAVESLRTVKKNARSPVATSVEAAGKFFTAEDYHQKYYLRKRPELVADLQQVYPGEGFVASTEAARINGYLGCNGNREEIENRLPSLGLSSEMQTRLVNYVSANCRRLAGLTCGTAANDK